MTLPTITCENTLVVRLERSKRDRQMTCATANLQIDERVAARASKGFTVPREQVQQNDNVNQSCCPTGSDTAAPSEYAGAGLFHVKT